MLTEGVAVAGIGQTPFHRRGTAPMGQTGLAVEAVLAACRDAGLDPHAVDGVCSYGHDGNDGAKLAAALGLRELRWASSVFGGGGGASAGAVAHAAAAVATGQADHVVVVRASAERSAGRLGAAVSADHMTSHYRAHGIVSPAQSCALRTQRLMEVDGVGRSALRALAQACYHHAQANPDAVGRGTHLTDEVYDGSRWIAEPYRLFDCSRENDGAGALLVTSLDRAQELAQPPVHVLAAAVSVPEGGGETCENDADYTSAGFRPLAGRLWAATGLGPSDVDNVQLYENFTGAAVAALLDFGLWSLDDVLTVEELTAPHGRLPVNTAGGNLAEGFVHGIGLMVEAVRQLRGTSANQVPDARVSLVVGGPLDTLVSAALLGRSRLADLRADAPGADRG